MGGMLINAMEKKLGKKYRNVKKAGLTETLAFE